jgi:hydrogenase expression/formation protein HypC
MCISVPGQVRSLDGARPNRAVVGVAGVDRDVSLDMLEEADRPQVGDWVLVYLGMAMAKVDEAEARETQQMIESMNAACGDLLTTPLDQSASPWLQEEVGERG